MVSENYKHSNPHVKLKLIPEIKVGEVVFKQGMFAIIASQEETVSD